MQGQQRGEHHVGDVVAVDVDRPAVGVAHATQVHVSVGVEVAIAFAQMHRVALNGEHQGSSVGGIAVGRLDERGEGELFSQGGLLRRAGDGPNG